MGTIALDRYQQADDPNAYTGSGKRPRADGRRLRHPNDMGREFHLGDWSNAAERSVG